MSRRYRVEDLLKLRESGLVRKPETLPDAEIWMGSLPETNARRTSTLRPKPDDNALQSEGFQKRPNLLDHSRKSATTSSELFLGPPKFRGRRKSNAQEEADDLKNKDNDSIHERSRNGEAALEKAAERKGGRPEGSNGRFISRQDKEEYQSSRGRRKDDDDNIETKPRQDLDWEKARPKWATRDSKTEQELGGQDKDGVEETGRTARRDLQPRAKFEQPWFRNEKAGDRKSDSRQHEWHRDREWDRSGRIEADPEWMDSTEPEEPPQTRTQEDFERWKERMKAGGTPTEEKAETLDKAATDTTNMVEQKKATKIPVATTINSVEMNDAMDKFFARFNEPKSDQDQTSGQSKAPVKTRFASLWSTPAEQPAPTPEPKVAERSNQVVETPTGADADQAGFARILQMLGSRSTTSTPQESNQQKPKTPFYARGDQEPMHERIKSPEQVLAFSQAEQLPRTSTSRNHEATGLERILNPRSPTEGAHTRQQSGTNKETNDILLNLMRQANINQQAQQTKALGGESHLPPNISHFTDSFNQAASARNNLNPANQHREQPTPQRRETNSSFFDDSQVSRIHFQEEQMPQGFQNNGLRRRPTNGLSSAFFDDPYLGQMRQSGQQQQKLPPTVSMNSQSLPPGLQRPPGLDQMPRMPPSWSNQQQQQQQQQQPQLSRPAPPPGISSLPRGMPAPFGGSNQPIQLPPHLQQQPTLTQQRPQRKYTGDSGPGPAFPPGMGPPPGFMNTGPPPGFPGAPQHYGRYQVGGEPQGMGRGFAEMYGNGAPERMPVRGGAPGAGGMPGGYR